MIGFLFSNLGRYLFLRSLTGIAIAFAAVTASILLVDVVEQLRTVGSRSDLSLWQAIGLTTLKAPMLIEQTLPFVVLAGVMLGLFQLNRRSELIALRASGVSAWRFLAPSGVLALLLGVLMITTINPVGAFMYERYELAKARLSGEANTDAVTRNGVWLRQGDAQMQIVIHARTVSADNAGLANATFFFFEEGKGGTLNFVRRIRAENVYLRPGFWQLTNLVEALPGASPMPQENLAIPTNLEPSALLNTFVTPGSLSFWQLPGFISQAKAAGLSPVRYEVKHQALIAFPLLLAAMASLGAVFSLRLQRGGGVGQWAGLGVAAGFGLFFAGQLASAFAATDVVPPVVAAWSPALTGVFSAFALLSFLEDG
jgi:lipopolysaccharide export system permease protein